MALTQAVDAAGSPKPAALADRVRQNDATPIASTYRLTLPKQRVNCFQVEIESQLQSRRVPLVMLIPLDMLRPGDWADVAAVSGEATWVHRLAELGIREGCRVQVLQTGSPCLLQVSNCKLCLRGCESSQILVSPVAEA